jgi:hypothetical protein
VPSRLGFRPSPLVPTKSAITAKDISTLPYLVITFGMLLVFGGIYRLHARQKTAQV